MHPEIFTEVWARAWCRELNASAAYRAAAATWAGAVALVMLADPSLGIASPRAVHLDLQGGSCRAARPVPADELTDARFVFEAPAAAWRELLAGRLSPLMALMNGKLRLVQGDLTALLPYATAARELVATAAVVQRQFPDPV